MHNMVVYIIIISTWVIFKILDLEVKVRLFQKRWVKGTLLFLRSETVMLIGEWQQFHEKRNILVCMTNRDILVYMKIICIKKIFAFHKPKEGQLCFSKAYSAQSIGYFIME